MSKISAYDFSQKVGDFSFGAKKEDVLRGLNILIEAIENDNTVFTSIFSSATVLPEEYTKSTLTFEFVEKY